MAWQQSYGWNWLRLLTGDDDNRGEVSNSNPLPVRVGSAEPVGYQQITDLDPAVELTIPADIELIYALIVCEAQAIRWTDDGTTPTASVGMPLATGVYMVVDAASLATFKAFEQASGAKLNIAYYGFPI